MPSVAGVHLLPATGEFTYDAIPYSASRSGAPLGPINTYLAPGGTKTDYSYAIDQLQTAHPECKTVSVVCAWFCDGLTAGACHVYPSTNYINGSFSTTSGTPDHWRVSGLTEQSASLLALPASASGASIYGGTPSDQSIVRCIRDLKTRGFNVIFYPFLLMTCSGLPWRGQITFAPDGSAAASAAVASFLGPATTSQFTPDPIDLTVGYTNAAADWTYRRMILHYAWLMTIAGGVNLFVIGSELRGLDTIRGPGWTPSGTVDSNGCAAWDYPFVAGLAALANDLRSIFDSAGLTRSAGSLANLITYSADWSNWMGYQHSGQNGQWPHLDSLWSCSAIDFVAFDNYLPLSDWTTGGGGLDAVNWSVPKPTGAWPPSSTSLGGLGLTGAPSLYSADYLKANIEGGEKFNWYYADGLNSGPGFDPLGSGLVVSLPNGDRTAQLRKAYYPNQQILANKQYRWWWHNTHQAIYDDGDGTGWSPHGPPTPWSPQSKSLVFLEYGIPSVDRGTNQPNVFYNAASATSATPYWSIWLPNPGGGFIPTPDDTLSSLALQAIYDYWVTDGGNVTSPTGVPMLLFTFSCLWNWDARPFPAFPLLATVWGDAPNWQYGNWLEGKGPQLSPAPSSPDPAPNVHPNFPKLSAMGWSTSVRPQFATDVADRTTGRSIRRPRYAAPLYDLELTYEVLRADIINSELQTLMGFFANSRAGATPFWIAPPGLSSVTGQVIGDGDGSTSTFPVLKTVGPYTGSVAATSVISAIYFDGLAQSSGWTTTGVFPTFVSFASAPPPGVAISADYSELWLCRFAEDVADLENFQSLLWNFRTVKLTTVRP